MQNNKSYNKKKRLKRLPKKKQKMLLIKINLNQKKQIIKRKKVAVEAQAVEAAVAVEVVAAVDQVQLKIPRIIKINQKIQNCKKLQRKT
jgi:hypothetical protein